MSCVDLDGSFFPLFCSFKMHNVCFQWKRHDIFRTTFFSKKDCISTFKCIANKEACKYVTIPYLSISDPENFNRMRWSFQVRHVLGQMT
jgi:hypothetical protein